MSAALPSAHEIMGAHQADNEAIKQMSESQYQNDCTLLYGRYDKQS